MTPVKFITPDDGVTAEDLAKDVDATMTIGTDGGETTEFLNDNPNWHTEVGTVTVGDVRIDPRVQRPENLRLTRKISRNLFIPALGTVTVSVRVNQGPNNDETWYILLDGQQRMIGASKAGYRGPVSAMFHFGLSLQEEARLFRLLNDGVDVPAADKYSVGLVEQLPDALLVQQVLDELEISLGNNPGQFQAVVFGRRIVSMPEGVEAFRWALKTVREFYAQDEVPRYEGRLVEALARMKVRYGSLINTRSLVTKVLKQGGPIYILKQARMKKEVNNTTAMVGTIEALIQTYNAYLQTAGGHKLPDWDRSKKEK
jgi:hypothetical protein